MLRKKQKTSEIQRRDPKEFAFLQIDLMPLVHAALADEWDEVKTMLDEGHSLLWLDLRYGLSAIKLIKEEGNKEGIKTNGIISKLVEYASKEYGSESESFQFVLLETSEKTVTAYVKIHNSIVGKRYSPDPDHESFPLTPESFYYLYLNNKYSKARKLLKKAYQLMKAKKITMDDFEACVIGFMRGAAKSSIDSELMSELEICTALFNDELEPALFKKLAISAASACWHYSFVRYHIKKAFENNDPNLDIYLGEAIIGAARGGRGDLIIDLLKSAKEYNVDKSERFLDSLACASGAALVNEHFMLAKTLMLMVPHFKAKPRDLKELEKWPQKKVERMFRIIRDYKMFTDIALHSCVASGINTKAWVKALEKEYGLHEMSDAGFKFIITQKRLMTFLLSYQPPENLDELKPNQIIDKKILDEYTDPPIEGKLDPQDIKAFLKALVIAREESKQPENKVAFYRLNFFTGNQTYKHFTPDEERLCLVVKEKISKLVFDAKNERFATSRSKDLASKFYNTLLDVCSLQKLQKVLQTELTKNPKSNLIKACNKIFNEHMAELKDRKKGVAAN